MQLEPQLLILIVPAWPHHSSSVALLHSSVAPPQPQCGSTSPTHSKLCARARARARITVLWCCPTRLRMQSKPQLLIFIAPAWHHHSPQCGFTTPHCGTTTAPVWFHQPHAQQAARARLDYRTMVLSDQALYAMNAPVAHPHSSSVAPQPQCGVTTPQCGFTTPQCGSTSPMHSQLRVAPLQLQCGLTGPTHSKLRARASALGSPYYCVVPPGLACSQSPTCSSP